MCAAGQSACEWLGGLWVLFLLKGFAVYSGKAFPSLPPPPFSICIKISVKIKVCFCILQIAIQTVSRKELVIHFYIQHIYTHARAPPKTIKLAGKKTLISFFLFKPKQTCTVTFKSFLKIAPHFCCRYEPRPFPFQLCFFLLKLNLLSGQARGWLSTMIY